MKTEFKLPELGENISGGDIVKVLVHVGQEIAANDGVIELETDKAVIEIPCSCGGKVQQVLVKAGQSVKVGQTILVVETEEEAISPRPQAGEGPGVKAASAPEGVVPLPRAAGTRAAGTRETTHAEKSLAKEPIPAGPAARRLARELGVELAQLQGTGQHGRITPEDVRAATEKPAAVERPHTGFRPSVPVVPPGEEGQDAHGAVRRDRMTEIRQTIAAQMTRSSTTIPHVTNFDDADVTELESLRRGVPEGFLGQGVKLSLMPFVLKASAMALKSHPVLNASLDEQSQQIVYKEYVNIGVAVDTPRGLVVPVMRGVDRLTVAQIAQSLAELAAKARGSQFGVEDLRGGSFTISNLGAVGGTYSTPIINHPEVAILLAGKARWLPAVREGRIEPRWMLPLSLSYDHRLVDGAAASRFLNEVIGVLQTPGVLCLW